MSRLMGSLARDNQTTKRALGLIDVSAENYHADLMFDAPTLSASIACRLIGQSPRHAWFHHPRLNPGYVRTVEDKFDLGTVAHQVLLEGEARVTVCDFKDWRSGDAKTAKLEARENGVTPLLLKDWERVQAMVMAAREQLAAHDVDPTPFTGGKPEQAIVWDEDGVTCRALVDWLHEGGRHISDYKTTSASADPHKWDRTMIGIGADVQVAFHCRAVMAATGALTWPEFRFVVQETYPPFELSVIGLSPDALKLADEKANRALAIWRECLAADSWPGYPERVAFIEAPGWAETQWLEREATREAA